MMESIFFCFNKLKILLGWLPLSLPQAGKHLLSTSQKRDDGFSSVCSGQVVFNGHELSIKTTAAARDQLKQQCFGLFVRYPNPHWSDFNFIKKIYNGFKSFTLNIIITMCLKDSR